MEADRLNMLVNDLTSLSKMQAGVDSLIPAAVDLKRIASDVIESFSLHAEQDGFRFDIESQGDTTVTADEKKIYQVFSNLIGNAVRYSAEDRQITVRITEKQDTVRCEIIDRGQGIAQKDLTAIWGQILSVQQQSQPDDEGFRTGPVYRQADFYSSRGKIRRGKRDRQRQQLLV